jgi:hypothetical protein
MTTDCKCNPCHCAPQCHRGSSCGCKQASASASGMCGADCACGCNSPAGKSGDTAQSN